MSREYALGDLYVSETGDDQFALPGGYISETQGGAPSGDAVGTISTSGSFAAVGRAIANGVAAIAAAAALVGISRSPARAIGTFSVSSALAAVSRSPVLAVGVITATGLFDAVAFEEPIVGDPFIVGLLWRPWRRGY